MAEAPETFAEFARSLARAARRETLAGCAAGLAGVENKLAEGFDPVTEHDRNSELAMRRLIEERFPGHGIQGEELPDRPAGSRWSWSLDPIDGTRAYICGLPSWTTLIALLDEGQPVLGLVDVPRLDELYLGHGGGAWRFGAGAEARRLATSACRRIEEARLSTTDPYLFEGAEAAGFERLRRKARLTRYGLDAYGYALVAAGTLEIVAESGLQPHDYNALVPLVRGAGGAVSNWSGGTDLAAGQIVAAANEALLEQACRLLGG
jgi:myo-inositol-1(or 4)-monophosphatase